MDVQRHHYSPLQSSLSLCASALRAILSPELNSEKSMHSSTGLVQEWRTPPAPLGTVGTRSANTGAQFTLFSAARFSSCKNFTQTQNVLVYWDGLRNCANRHQLEKPLNLDTLFSTLLRHLCLHEGICVKMHILWVWALTVKGSHC